jgi:hypothetical protein
MFRTLISRATAIAAGALVLSASCLSTSCGGGGFAARQMVLVEFLFVDRSLQPTAPTGAQSLPRNAQIVLVFSEKVYPPSVNNQTIQIRFGAQFQSVPTGSFSVDGNRVRFDPTVTNQGLPNPFGFDPITQYIVDVPNSQDQDAVVRNLDDDPNTSTFFTSFVTSDGFLRELIPPQLVEVFFVPDPDPLTGNIPGNGVMGLRFSEPMDPGSFILGPQLLGVLPAPPLPPQVTVDVRYDANEQVNIDWSVAGKHVPGYFAPDPSATIYFFNPTFSFGDKKFKFYVQELQGLKDLSGNPLVNPGSQGLFTCDGFGIATGQVLEEKFADATDLDALNSGADWGGTEPGVLQGLPVSTRHQYIFGYTEAGNSPDSSRGQYAAIVDPLIGADLNNFVPNVNPATSQGRRVMIGFGDTDLGADGTITAAGWGPDSNATFAAIYPSIFLRMGFQSNNSVALSPTFSGNYQGSPQIVYTGDYQVTQAANIGNTPGHPAFAHVGPYIDNPGCSQPNQQTLANWNQPLFDFTGFAAWPAFTTFFDWDDGDPIIENDSVFLWDMSVPEGDSFQQIRAWFAATFPCSGILIGGYPARRLYSVYEDDTANPTTNLLAGIINPEPTIYDTHFVVTKRVSIAQTLFYTYSGFPQQSIHGQTFGDLTNYYPAQITPLVQTGGAQISILYQGADTVQSDRRTINQAAPFTGWTNNINDCDGMRCLRWRISLISNLISSQVARVNQVTIPMTSN